jgi:hypothetical protein
MPNTNLLVANASTKVVGPGIFNTPFTVIVAEVLEKVFVPVTETDKLLNVIAV